MRVVETRAGLRWHSNLCSGELRQKGEREKRDWKIERERGIEGGIVKEFERDRDIVIKWEKKRDCLCHIFWSTDNINMTTNT